MDKNVHDPLGTLVRMETRVSSCDGVAKDISNIKNDIIKTIEHPTKLIQVSAPELARYYYKIIDENKTLLISAHYKQSRWTTKEYFENPTKSFMLSIFQRGIRLL